MDVFICLCLSVVKDEREMASPVSWKVFTPVESRRGRDSAVFELVSLVPSSYSTSQQRWFHFYCVPDTMMLLFSVHKLCPDDCRCQQYGQCQKCILLMRERFIHLVRHFQSSSWSISVSSIYSLKQSSTTVLHFSPSIVSSLTSVQCPLLWTTIFFKCLTKWKFDDSSWD